MKLILVTTFQQLADILTNPLHFPQSQACVAGILGKKKVTTTKRPIKSGGPLGAVAKAIKSRYDGPSILNVAVYLS
jgi:hypothetical protein